MTTDNSNEGINLNGFRWSIADDKLGAGAFDDFVRQRGIAQNKKAVEQPPLGPLTAFKGVFAGHGFNTIFRPANVKSGDVLPNPVTGPRFPTAPNDNILELNLTQETLTFSAPLGNVPNRGFGRQQDIFLNGVPYLQIVNDVANPATGKADGKPVGIHTEPGVWMHIPETNLDPVLGASLSRMGSIPHGTTVNAQCLAPTSSIKGPPRIPSVDITPFIEGSSPPTPAIPGGFPSQHVSDANTARIPQDLTKFAAQGTITQEVLDDPNVILRNAIKGQTITDTVVFTVSTAPKKPELGGGTANIAFLGGTDVTATTDKHANANAVKMQATFWIETVEHKIKVPHHEPNSAPIKIQPEPQHPGAQTVPTFVVHPANQGQDGPRTVMVKSTQIQYSQTVFLNFNGLSWPHVSLATLAPREEHHVHLSDQDRY